MHSPMQQQQPPSTAPMMISGLIPVASWKAAAASRAASTALFFAGGGGAGNEIRFSTTGANAHLISSASEHVAAFSASAASWASAQPDRPGCG